MSEISDCDDRALLDYWPVKTMAVPLAIPEDLRAQVARGARKANAKKAEVYRLAIRCGLKEAELRLSAESDRLFPGIEPIPPRRIDAMASKQRGESVGENRGGGRARASGARFR